MDIDRHAKAEGCEACFNSGHYDRDKCTDCENNDGGIKMRRNDDYIEREIALEICDKEYKERLRMLDYCGDTVAGNIGGALMNGGDGHEAD